MVKAVGRQFLEYTGKIQPQLGERGANGQLLYPYLPNPELVEAVNLAIYLERPLLLKGEPGCGKTLLSLYHSAMTPVNAQTQLSQV
ncbi:hypothetical protein [Nostoc sp. DedSLP04]|uniref:hypothetical protein n=1 Tax=Nostoc sp. DedSLP04 TaxID=3075401 RepID=UPI002AD37357|nr:hypothetical protein [Nostoc sp. DedSLP04]MDZ8032535.1 hypothetical protein [Nostoc sp. DedSLP04]